MDASACNEEGENCSKNTGEESMHVNTDTTLFYTQKNMLHTNPFLPHQQHTHCTSMPTSTGLKCTQTLAQHPLSLPRYTASPGYQDVVSLKAPVRLRFPIHYNNITISLRQGYVQAMRYYVPGLSCPLLEAKKASPTLWSLAGVHSRSTVRHELRCLPV